MKPIKHPQTILVTGARGFTGRHLCHALRNRGHRVIGLTQHAVDDADTVACDLMDSSALQSTLTRIKPDQVVHLAALAFIASNEAAEAYYRTNVVGTCNLLNALEKVQPNKVLIASSANIYGQPDDGKPITENTPPAPVNHYGASKLAMEHMVRTYAHTLPIIITRPFNYTGPGQDEHFLVPKIVSHFRHRASEIELGNLDVSRDFTSIHDLVEAYIMLLESEITGETFNVCSGTTISLKQILDWLMMLSGHSLTVNVNPIFVRKNEIKLLVGDHTHLSNLTGWAPKQTFIGLLKEMLAYPPRSALLLTERE
ncbi:MAG: NAD-dependent epimerase/dehydratase [Gammaproteobacteria bacterium]|nr:NAD-dependent epimerase/dehydratase [Gammaproteobacteria bacterium]